MVPEMISLDCTSGLRWTRWEVLCEHLTKVVVFVKFKGSHMKLFKVQCYLQKVECSSIPSMRSTKKCFEILSLVLSFSICNTVTVALAHVTTKCNTINALQKRQAERLCTVIPISERYHISPSQWWDFYSALKVWPFGLAINIWQQVENPIKQKLIIVVSYPPTSLKHVSRASEHK